MVARAAPTTATKARFETELGRVHGCVRREFLRAGIRSEPWGEWPLEEKWGRDLQKVATSPECHRLTTVFFAAEVVQKTYDSLYGPREAVIGALEELTAAVQRANAVAREDGVKAYLTSVANIGWQFAFQEEERVDSRELPALRDSLHWELLRDFAEAADAVAKHLRLRRPPALDANAYATKGAGPIAHFCYELFRPDPAPSGGRSPGLLLEEIAQIINELPKRESYELKENWVAGCEQAKEKIRSRIGRFSDNVRKRTPA